jgi:hypothetical protein
MKRIVLGLAICAVATSAVAQVGRPRVRPAPIIQPQTDTMLMTCAQASALVTSRQQGIVLKTGANFWDRYVPHAAACMPNEREASPAFVRTRDNMICHIGFTCEDANDDNGDD